MRTKIKMIGILTLLVLAPAGRPAQAAAAPADNQASITIVFQDGHRQNLEMAKIARIEFNTPVVIVFKDGRQQTIPAPDIARIDFETATSSGSRNRFVGKWEVGRGNGSNFYITLNPDGEASKTIDSRHGTWIVVAGEARITWDDGWHDAIRKVGTKYEKFAYEPGKSFDDPPTNVTTARNLELKPI
jgi:hypothetical protein